MADIDPRLLSTPLGAALGLLAVRGILPEKYRTGKSYAAGAGVGGGLGYLGGAYAAAPETKELAEGAKGVADSAKRKLSGQKEPDYRDKLFATLKNLQNSLDQSEGAPVESMGTEHKAIEELLGQTGYETGPSKQRGAFGGTVEYPSETVNVTPARGFTPGTSGKADTASSKTRAQEYERGINKNKANLMDARLRVTDRIRSKEPWKPTKKVEGSPVLRAASNASNAVLDYFLDR